MDRIPHSGLLGMMDVMVHAKLHKPDRMSNQEFFSVWKQEAAAALGALRPYENWAKQLDDLAASE